MKLLVSIYLNMRRTTLHTRVTSPHATSWAFLGRLARAWSTRAFCRGKGHQKSKPVGGSPPPHRPRNPRQHRLNFRHVNIIPLTPRDNAYALLFTDFFSRHTDMYAVTEVQFTASGTADNVMIRYKPLPGGPVTPLSDNGLDYRIPHKIAHPR